MAIDVAPSVPHLERAQDLADRIAAISLAPPHIDERRVDAAMQRALDAAGVTRRPLRWFPDSLSAHRHVYAVAFAASRKAVRNAVTVHPDTAAWNAAMESSWDRAWRMARYDASEAARRASIR